MKTTKEKARFDTRLPKEQKEMFERAAILGGFRNLTDFIIVTVQEKANKIIKDNNTVLASQKDKEIFFNALINPKNPNDELMQAAEFYKKTVS